MGTTPLDPHLQHIRSLDLDGKYQEVADYLLTLDIPTLERLQREAGDNEETEMAIPVINLAHLIVSISQETAPHPSH